MVLDSTRSFGRYGTPQRVRSGKPASWVIPWARAQRVMGCAWCRARHKRHYGQCTAITFAPQHSCARSKSQRLMSRSCKRYFNEWVSVAIGFMWW